MNISVTKKSPLETCREILDQVEKSLFLLEKKRKEKKIDRENWMIEKRVMLNDLKIENLRYEHNNRNMKRISHVMKCLFDYGISVNNIGTWYNVTNSRIRQILKDNRYKCNQNTSK